MANRGKVESYRRIKGVNGRLVLGEEELRRIWKDYFDDLYNTDKRRLQSTNVISMAFRRNYLGGLK